MGSRGEWYRYHHLLQQLLIRELRARRGNDEIAMLHTKASDWFAANGLIEDAIGHALKANDNAAAARLVRKHADELMHDEQWARLGRWLDLLGTEVVDQEPQLLLLRAWWFDFRHELPESWKCVDQALALVSSIPETSPLGRRLRGEAEAILGKRYYLQGDGRRALASEQRAVSLLPRAAQCAVGFAHLIAAASHQMVGQLDQGYQVLYDAMNSWDPSATFMHGRLLTSLCWLHYMAGDLSGMKQTSSSLLRLASEPVRPELRDAGRYFQGVYYYHRNNLNEAEKHLTIAVEKPFETRTEFYVQGAFALASCFLAQGRVREAEQLTEAVIAHVLDVRNTSALHLARGFEAELNLRLGRLTAAHEWAQSFDMRLLPPLYMFFVPHVTLAKIHLAKTDPDSLRRASEILGWLLDLVSQTHNTRFQIEVLALQALLHDAQGNEADALDVLGQTIKLAQPGGFVRIFADLGATIGRMLNRLELDESGLVFAGQTLAALRTDEGTASLDGRQAHIGAKEPQTLHVDPLSKREIEILTLIAKRLSNQEIADQLHISTVTVKRHSANIYEKLGVHGRRDAAAKAEGLGILAT